MKKSVTVIIIMITILTLACIPPLKAQAQTQNIITIKADGTVTPLTAPIREEAGTYTLTEDFEGSILIQGSNIVFNGGGYSLQCLQNSRYCVKLLYVSNITIKDLTVRGSSFGCIYGMVLENAIDCTITNNTITDVWSFLGLNGISYEGVYVSGGGSNVFTKNSLVNNSLGMHFESTDNNVIIGNSIDYVEHSVDSSISGIYFNNAYGNIIYHNNFRAEVGGQADAYGTNNTWDNGYPSGGNYWIDYHARYPNATMIDDSGIGDMAYVIGDQNRDNYPLMEPFNATALAEASPTPSVTATAGPNGKSATDFTVFELTAAVIIMVLAIAGLAVYFKRRRRYN